MFAVVVREVVIDSLLLHQTADEIEIRFPVLDAVFPLAIAAAKRILEIGKALLPENVFNDVGNRLVLEDPAIGSTGEKPQPRTQFGAINAIAQTASSLVAKAGHESVELKRVTSPLK